jgi:hypothetical protein
MEVEQVTALVLLDFSQAFDMVIHGLLLCNLKNLQNYSDVARKLVDSYLNDRTQFVRCGEKESSVGRVACGVPQGPAVVGLFYLFFILMTFRRYFSSSTAGFIFMRMIFRFITVLVFRIHKSVMMRSTWICRT